MFVYLLHNSRPIQQKHLAHVLEDCAWTMTTSIAYMTVSYFGLLFICFNFLFHFFLFLFHFLCLASYKGVKAFNTLPPSFNHKNQVHANTFDESRDNVEFSMTTIDPDYNFEFDTEEDIMTTTGFKRIPKVFDF